MSLRSIIAMSLYNIPVTVHMSAFTYSVALFLPGSPPTPSPVLSPEGTASLVGVVCFAFGILLGLAIGGLVGYCYKCVRVKQKLNKVASSKTPSSNGSG